MTDQFDIFPPDLVARAIRDNGYKTTAHAVAELVDNSAQARATVVQLIAVEKPELVVERRMHRIQEIAVLDNGSGMDDHVLRMALQFGNGTRLDDRSGIGRFGMGLPTASLSQCEHVDVWSWVAGPDNAIHTMLDLPEISERHIREVPEPLPSPVPEIWRELSDVPLGPTGTLVVWSELDRVTWRGAKATLENVEQLVGRMYRHLIHEDGLRIRLSAVREGIVHWSMDTRVNDPLYLMSPSSTPAPFGDRAMFRPYGEGSQQYSIDVNDEAHTVVVKCSWASEEAMQPESGLDPGHESYGKHAVLNRGVSIVRARRELDLVTHWNRGETFRDRWWSIEVQFPPALDELFGVTNNKQAATQFTEMAEFFADEQRESEWEDRRNDLESEGDPRFHLMDIAKYIADQRKNLRRELKALQSGRRSKETPRHSSSIEDQASRKIKQRIEEGGPHVAIVDDATDDETKREGVFRELRDEGGVSERDAREIADAVVQRDRKIIFVTREDDSDAFFSAKALPGVHEVRINSEHPVYDGLLEVLDAEDTVGEDADDLRIRLGKASDTLKMMLCAWVRYELEAREMRQRQIRDARREWGKMVRRFLEEE